MFASCGKEGTDTSALQGTWVIYKCEARFNGAVVASPKPYIKEVSFQNSIMTIVNQDYSEPYQITYQGGIIYSLFDNLPVISFSKKEFVFDDPVMKGTCYVEELETTYKGVDIYTSGDWYWYYDKNGGRVFCEPEYGEDYSDIDYWYDNERYYASPK